MPWTPGCYSGNSNLAPELLEIDSLSDHCNKDEAMLIVLDRNRCTSQDHACESCFANHLVHNDFDKATCWQKTEDSQRSDFIFKIYDRDLSIKSLVVKQENLMPALVSWIECWEQQSGPVI
jgi:hypothetical protein